MVLRPCVPQKTAKLTCGVVRVLAANLSLLQLMMELSHRLKKPLHFHSSSSIYWTLYSRQCPAGRFIPQRFPKALPPRTAPVITHAHALQLQVLFFNRLFLSCTFSFYSSLTFFFPSLFDFVLFQCIWIADLFRWR